MRIKEYRIKLSMSQKDLAEKCGVSKNYISEIENGHKIPSVNLLLHLSRILDVCPCMILRFKCRNC